MIHSNTDIFTETQGDHTLPSKKKKKHKWRNTSKQTKKNCFFALHVFQKFNTNIQNCYSTVHLTNFREQRIHIYREI